MSYNSAYRQDDKPNMSSETLSYTQTTLNQIFRTFLSGPPPPPPPPPFGSSTIDFSSLDQPTLDSIGSGWTEIKYLPGNATRWFPGNETWDYTGTEFLFTRGDFSAWLICDKFQAVGEAYNGIPRIITKSSISATEYTAIWFNRPIGLDPVISLQDSDTS
jgi:hypothetical protein